ncbi:MULTISPECIES: BLUF domain-containing protein [unclassified Algibacter]|uniref:BLUF domain-containing protein n=1 Tax=unclassified Algibacter TaxID=2615009 RepID=UPI00131A62FC|nr:MULTISPECIES: BLUF domain-containing protein [unclassified Algibacter]MCL5128841.1 BLUF domain-containing protein [Algibacter sp. L4_22]
MTLRRLIYSSQAVKLFNKRELLDLLHESRGFNSIDNISGVLMHKEGYFLQVIEGDPIMIHDLFNRIEKDPRHMDLKILHDCTIKKRMFSNWNMGCTDFDDPELSMLPGLRTDLTNPEVIEELITNLPDVASILKENFLN